MELPDCDNIYSDTFTLSELERERLIELLVKKGEKGLDEFLESESLNVRSKVEEIRKLLEEQAKRIREQIEGRFKQDEATRELKWEAEKSGQDLSEDERAYLKKSGKLLDRELSKGLEDILLANDLVRLTIEEDSVQWKFKKSLWRRFVEALKNFFMKIWAVILRIYYWFRAKIRHEEDPVQRFRREQAGKKISIYLPFDNLRDYYNKVESKFGNALLHSPKLQAAVDRRLKMGSQIDSNEITINKYTSQQEYMKAAKMMFRESLNAELTPKKKAQDAVKKRIEKKSKSQKRAEATYKKSLESLRKRREGELKKLESDLQNKPKQMLKETLARQMEDIGYLNRKQLDDSTVRWEITHNLVERFASLIFAEEIKNLPDTTRAKFGASPMTQGYYDKGLLRLVEEESRMDIAESMLNARINHPKSRGMEDSDIYVKRDIHGTGVHVVIMFDRSGSMDENQRLDAAKRAVMALFKAIRLNNPQNIVDVIAFDTRAEIVSLMDVWNCQPKGFTNTGEALRIADQLLGSSKVDRRMVYLVTDGLPEAYRKGDEFIAGDNAKAMEYALENAQRFKRYKNLRFIMLLLEPKEQVYIDAAKKISEVVNGKIITTDPKKLVSDLLVDYIGK